MSHSNFINFRQKTGNSPSGHQPVMNKQIVVHLYNGIVLTKKKPTVFDTDNSVGEP